MSDQTDDEVCVLTSKAAKELAAKYKRYDDANPEEIDPLPSVPYSLLSAEHIRDYVLKTGLVAPFYQNGGKKSRLKDAAYEGRIGKIAYQYMPGNNFPEIIYTSGHAHLTVPSNSIVFVECDLDFRLPEFIALRFNLQIKHVHRGLLLGTGPLVDPGYWGKLCIPLHNLTDEDYVIDKYDGLIWIEFTKTTSKIKSGDERIGRPPLGKPFWDIKEFLEKATKPIDYAHPRVGIHSAIPAAYEASLKLAKEAQKSAATSRKFAIAGGVAGGIAALAVIISVFALSYNYYSDMDMQFKEIKPEIFMLKSELDKTVVDISTVTKNSASFEEELIVTRMKLFAAQERIEDLEADVNGLLTSIEVQDSENTGSQTDISETLEQEIAE